MEDTCPDVKVRTEREPWRPDETTEADKVSADSAGVISSISKVRIYMAVISYGSCVSP